MPIFTKIQKFEGEEKTVTKFVFEKEDDIAVEAVLYKYPDYKTRTVLCISTQCGCQMGCTFCGTGRFFFRDLKAIEIVEQVKQALLQIDCSSESIEKFQIMLMSMGEPFLNYHQVETALIALAVYYPNAQLLVSTSAPPQLSKNMVEFSKLCRNFPQIGLQFSIHESTDLKRQEIIPNSSSLDVIRRWGEYWAMETGKNPFFNYCVTRSNNGAANACQLKALFNPSIWKATLSVVCEKDQTKKGTWKEQIPMVQKFSELLLEKGYDVRIFSPDGQDDIGGGCGQLHYFQKFVKRQTDAS